MHLERCSGRDILSDITSLRVSGSHSPPAAAMVSSTRSGSTGSAPYKYIFLRQHSAGAWNVHTRSRSVAASWAARDRLLFGCCWLSIKRWLQSGMAFVAGRIKGFINENPGRFPGVTTTEIPNSLRNGPFKTCLKLEGVRASGTSARMYVYVMSFGATGLRIKIAEESDYYNGEYTGLNDEKLLSDIQGAFLDPNAFPWTFSTASRDFMAKAPDCDPVWHTLNRLASVVEQLAHKKRSLSH